MNQQEDTKMFWFSLKKKVSKNGKTFYTNGKFAYLLEIIAFEKNDGSGDISIWLKPKAPDQQNKGYSQQQQAPPRPQPPQQKQTPKPFPSGPPPPEFDEMPSFDEEY